MTMILRIALISAAMATTLGSASYAGSSIPPLDLGYSVASVTIADLKAMEGQRVIGKHRELIGHIGKVDVEAKLVELKTSEGVIVPISLDLLSKDGDTLAAPALSRGDILAMIDIGKASSRDGAAR
jgi:hypothetical protein